MEMSVDIELGGDFAASYTKGDNSKVIATDSMKNTVYVLAKENDFNSIEAFAVILARHFVKTYRQVRTVKVWIEQPTWDRVRVNGRSLPHSFVAGSAELRTCRAIFSKENKGPPSIISGLKGLKVLNTTDSEFSNFVSDRYRTLKDAADRIMATSVDAHWHYLGGRTEYNANFAAARGAMVKAFATHHSLSVQQTLLKMGEAVLKACPKIRGINFELPNLHRIPFDVERFGLKNGNDIFVPTDEPHGLIKGVVARR